MTNDQIRQINSDSLAIIEKQESARNGVYIESTPAAPSDVLDGSDINTDIHQLLGYVWSVSKNNDEFPSEHFSDLAQFFLDKHRTKDHK